MIGRIAAAGRHHAALTAGSALAGSRSLADGPTAGELLLEADFGRAVRPLLADLYWRPIVDGLQTMVGQSEDEIVRSTLAYYADGSAVDPLRSRLRQFARRGFNLGGQMGLEELELEGWFELSDDVIAGKLDNQVERLLNIRRQSRMSVAVTTAEEIGRQVGNRRDEGLTVVDMLPLLSAWVLGRTIIRSAVIATTETVRMSRWGMVSAFAGNGIRGVVHECALDVEQRCSGECPALCGMEYELGGVFNPMRGIPSAGQIPLHPRCILPGNGVVVPGRLTAATKSFYHGPAIEITVAGGRVLTVTENHPILTPRGYVAAKLLRQGDEVISCTNADRVAAAVNPDDDHRPTAIEEVFCAFKESPAVASRRVPVTAKYFHGDGRAVYGDIDVVYIDCLLERGGVPSLVEHGGQLEFSGDGMTLGALAPAGHVDLLFARDRTTAGCIVGGDDLGGSIVRGHERPFEKLGFGTAAKGDTGREQTATNGAAGDVQTIGDGLHGLAGQVTADNGVGIQGQPVDAPVLERPSRAYEANDYALRHALLARQFVDRFAAHVTTNKVVGVREFVFTGHVYDLQCDDYELYITEGIITSNCRCFYSPLRDGWLKPALIWTGFALDALSD